MPALAAPRARGSALLLTLIALAVLLLLTLGAIEFTGINRRAAASQLSSERISSCAETARRYLLSRLSVFQLPGTIQLDKQLLDDANPTDRSRMMTAHYNAPDDSATVVAVGAESFSASRNQGIELGNTLPNDTTRSGGYFRVVVLCREFGSREAELEFLFRYGL